MSIVTTTYDTKPVEAFLNRLGTAHLGESVKRAVAEGMTQSTIRAFETERTPTGQPWQPLAQVTLKARRRRGNLKSSILRDTGLMFSTLRPVLINGQPAVAVGAGIPDPRAEVAQKGNARVPKRPYFPENENASNEWWAGVTRPIRDAWSATR